jgi:thiol-disulfide isomerase/thioredoxin
MIGGLLALALAAPGLRADDKPAKAEDYKALQKEFTQAQTKLQEKQKELVQAFQKAKTQEEKKEIAKKFETLQKELDKFGARFLAYAEKNPKAPDAYDALFQTLRLSGGPMGKSGLWGKAMAALQKDQVKNENMAKLVPLLGGSKDEATIKLLKAIVEQNPNPKTQAHACKALAKSPNKDDADKYAKLLKDKYADVFPDLSVGKKAPEVVSQDLSGKKVKLSDYKGKVVVLDIWATWCGPCRAMIPHERELVKRLKDKPFALISISADEKKETLTKFLGETPMPWTHWWNGSDGGILADWEVQFFPTIYVLDAKGVIRYKGVRGKQMDEAVETLLKEMGVKIEPAKEEKKDSGKDKKDS